MLVGIAKRLGFILFLAVSARLIGGLFSPAHPKNDVEMVDWNGHRIPKSAMETSALAAPIDDPVMQKALASLPIHGSGPGAKMTYRSADGPVTLTPNDVAELNLRYRRLMGEP